MKKKTLLFIGILLISALSTCLFSSCDKDTWCYIDVTVLDSKNNNAPAAGAWVKIQYVKENESDPNNPTVGTIADTGQCNSQGIYQTKFAAPAIFTVIARVDEPDTLNHKFYYRQGEKSVRLKSGETVTTTVKVVSEKILGRADFQEI
ncbi:MAG: hypothetical protein MJZ99_06300 [Bacteroidales bacterium]|nr:hypothetical protein [Candidatus Colimorpha merdihippi]MCQ2282217.1 hypothetical protein [Bacteroidales bacterium]